MTRKCRAGFSSLFLMELIPAILILAAAGTVCIQLFAKSHLLSRNSTSLNHAVHECSGIAEIIQASGGMTGCLALLQNQYPDAAVSDTSKTARSTEFTIYYDRAFTACGSTDAYYMLTLRLSEAGQMLEASLQVQNHTRTDIIYELETKHHIARRTTHEQT